IAGVEINARPWRIGLLDNLHRRFRRGCNPAIVLDAQYDALAAGVLRRTLQHLDRPWDPLSFRSALRNRAAEDAHVARAQFLRHVDPLPRRLDLRRAQLRRRLAQSDPDCGAVELDAVLVGGVP